MKIFRYFSKAEWTLWCVSVSCIVGAFCLFDGKNVLTITASLVGATSLIFNAKGNPTGQLLMVLFSVLYGVISFQYAYYGEMITYLGMTAPMAVISFFAWIKNPYKKAQVKVNQLRPAEIVLALLLTILVTTVFYFVLRKFHTANLILSTVSVITSFLAVYLTFRRSAYYALAYAANDIVLIGLWILAAQENGEYFSVVICFLVFLCNDIYGFFKWRNMYYQQNNKNNNVVAHP